MSADTRGIRELAEALIDSQPKCKPSCDGDLVGIEHDEDCPLFDKRELGTVDLLTAFAESIVEQCCKVEIRHVDILCAPERWDVLLNGKRVHYFGYEHEAEELKENIESAIRSRWHRGEGQ